MFPRTLIRLLFLLQLLLFLTTALNYEYQDGGDKLQNLIHGLLGCVIQVYSYHAVKKPLQYCNLIDLSYNDVKCGFEMLHEVGLTLEKYRANHIECNMNFSAFDVIIRKVY